MVDSLSAQDLAGLWPPAAAGWLEHRPDGAYLTHRDGACVFLQPDQRCFLHAHFGAAAKPGFCRIFPLRITEGPSGMTATVRPECSRYHRTHSRGAPISAAVSQLSGLSVPITRLREVNLLPGQPLLLSDWPPLETRLLSALSGDGQPEARIAVVRPLLGLPPTSNEPGYHRASAALVYALRAALADTEASDQRLALADILPRLSALPPPLSAADAAYSGVVFRGHVAAGAFQAHGSVTAGLGRVLLETILARWSLLHRGGTFGDALASWRRLTANPTLRPLLRAAAPALIDLVRFAPG